MRCHTIQVLDAVLTIAGVADRELLLIEGISLQGLGNWQAVSEHVGTRTKEEVEEHYNNVYINSPFWPLPVRVYMFTHDHTTLSQPNYSAWIFNSTSTHPNSTNANDGA